MSAAPDSSPCSIHETVQSAFAVNDLAVLQDCCADLGRKMNAKYRSSIQRAVAKRRKRHE